MNPRIVVSRAALVAALVAAGWPVLQWYLLRLSDGTDEPLGLVALGLAALFAPRHRATTAGVRSGWWAPPSAATAAGVAVLTVLYFLTHYVAPPLVRALVWVAAIALAAAGPGTDGRGRVPLAGWGLLLSLSLPVVATAQFYLGFPLRWLTTACAAALLRLGGLAVRAEATVLHWGGERVLVDAPCSGIQMLWTLLVITAAAACAQHLSGRETLALLRRAGLAVFVANTLRTVALFCLEMGIWPTASWAHDAVGLLAFTGAAVVVLGGGSVRTAGLAGVAALECPGHDPAPATRGGRFARGGLVLALVLVLGVAGVMALVPKPRAAVPDLAFPGWDTAPLPDGVRQVPLTERDARFARQFPGRVGVFTDGRATWIVRWVTQPTRSLHPGGDCLRAGGFRVTPGQAFRDPAGALWSGAEARRDTTVYRVRERLVGADGRAWTDVSAWFWSATLQQARGPWWAVTRLDPLPGVRAEVALPGVEG